VSRQHGSSVLSGKQNTVNDRLYLAGVALQGLLAARQARRDWIDAPEGGILADAAVSLADALLARLDATSRLSKSTAGPARFDEGGVALMEDGSTVPF
jgi:hypothetical protein